MGHKTFFSGSGPNPGSVEQPQQLDRSEVGDFSRLHGLWSGTLPAGGYAAADKQDTARFIRLERAVDNGHLSSLVHGELLHE